jgi:hypothetical protein
VASNFGVRNDKRFLFNELISRIVARDWPRARALVKRRAIRGKSMKANPIKDGKHGNS